MKNTVWFFCGLLMGLTALTFARGSTPTRGRVTDDTAIYDRLSEIHVKKQGKLDFDAEIASLSRRENEKKFDEKLPSLTSQARLKGPINRITRQKYSR